MTPIHATSRLLGASLALSALLSAAPAADLPSPYSAADIDRLAADLDQVSRKISQEVDDGTVAREVGRDIVYGLGTEISGLFVTSDDGIVTLKGTVESDETAELAVGRATRIDGVHRVVNRLRKQGEEVPADAAPIVAAAAADPRPIDFLTDAGLAGRDISVVDDDGVITVSGHVNNNSARTLVVVAARRIDGARAVVDRLTIVPHSGGNDDNLAEIVRFRLGEVASLRELVGRQRRRPSIERFGDDLVQVHVEDSVAVLAGRVPSERQRDALIERTAATSGIFAVHADGLVVDPDARPLPTRRGPPVAVRNYGTLRR